MSKSLLQVLFFIVLIVTPVNTRKVYHLAPLTAHELNIGEIKINELLQKVLPNIDVHKPLGDLGYWIGRGGRAISPALGKAGHVSTAIGVVFLNIGALLLTLSQILSSQGAIGGNPNFLNEALSAYLAAANLNVQFGTEQRLALPQGGIEGDISVRAGAGGSSSLE